LGHLDTIVDAQVAQVLYRSSYLGTRKETLKNSFLNVF